MSKFSYSFRKYPLLRVGLYVFFILTVVICLYVFSYKNQSKPVVDSISPIAAGAGDILTIKGKNFGQIQEDSFVQIENSRFSASSYLSWNNNEIKLKVPQSVQDGFLFVKVGIYESNKKIFTNRDKMPIVLNSNRSLDKPSIKEINCKGASIGDFITISGKNFGASKSNSKVAFSWADSSSSRPVATVFCEDAYFDYNSWSNNEIIVRVPDGAVTGDICVITENGESNKMPFSIHDAIGKKIYSDKKTVVLDISVDISEAQCLGPSILTLRIPKPIVTDSQRSVQIQSSKPEPAIVDFMNTIIHQIDLDAGNSVSASIAHSFVISNYAVNTDINVANVSSYKDKKSMFYTVFTKSDDLIVIDESIKKLSQSIIKDEKNPYLQAKLIYYYIINNYRLVPVQTDKSYFDMIALGIGDAYDFTMLFTALARAAGIPSISDAGILIDKSLNTKPHWWNQFYIEGFGWIPVDTALVLDSEYQSINLIENPSEYYFGNIDNDHIIFSRGLNDFDPMSANAKIVHKNKTFALQTIWEESMENATKYTSYWGCPQVSGMYK